MIISPFKVLAMLPQIDTKMTITGDLPGARKSLNNDADKGKVSKVKIDMSSETRAYSLFEDEEYVLSLDLTRANRTWSKGGRFNGKAYTPKYTKPKDENWVLILGENTRADDLTSQLVGLKRVTSLKRQQSTNLVFKTPLIDENRSASQYVLSVYLLSDVYLGLDQQFDINFKLIKKKN